MSGIWIGSAVGDFNVKAKVPERWAIIAASADEQHCKPPKRFTGGGVNSSRTGLRFNSDFSAVSPSLGLSSDL